LAFFVIYMSTCPSVCLQYSSVSPSIYPQYLSTCTSIFQQVHLYPYTFSSIQLRHSSVSVNLFIYIYLDVHGCLLASSTICQYIHLCVSICSLNSAIMFVTICLTVHLVLFPSAEQRDMVELWLRPVTQNCTVFKNRSHVGYIRRLWRVPWEAANPPL
jgi:hypothetical protein